jgi:hypothetical protein
MGRFGTLLRIAKAPAQDRYVISDEQSLTDDQVVWADGKACCLAGLHHCVALGLGFREVEDRLVQRQFEPDDDPPLLNDIAAVYQHFLMPRTAACTNTGRKRDV